MLDAVTITVSELASQLLTQSTGERTDAFPDSWDERRKFGHFLALARDEGFDLNEHAAAVVDGGLVIWACVAVRSPGRASMLMMPPLPGRDNAPGRAGQPFVRAIDLMVARERDRGVALVQALLPPNQSAEGELLLACRFTRLAELIYLRGSLPAPDAANHLPASLTVETFSPELEPEFASVIRASYERTLDCPGLEGVRQMEDILAGHRGSGVYRPSLWFLYRQAAAPVGIVLLNEVADQSHSIVELVYMGLVLSARGQGLGRLMFRHAMAHARRAGYRGIMTAVDSRNIPAARLYCGHGLRETTRRIAYIMPVSNIASRRKLAGSPASDG